MTNLKAGLLISLALAAFAALPAQAQETVQARGWAKSTYGRIIFDWQKPVEHSARIEGSELIVEFSRAMRGDLSRLVGSLSGYVNSAKLEPGGKTARFGLAGAFEVASFETGSSVVVDLRRGGSAAAAAAPVAGAPVRSSGGGLRVDVGRHPGFTRLVFNWSEAVDYSVSRDGSGVSMRFDKSGSIDVDSLDAALPKPAFGTPRVSGGRALSISLSIPEQSYIRHFREGNKVVLDVQEPGGDFGNMLFGATAGVNMETISPSGEVMVVPAMVGTHVAVTADSNIPLITEKPEADGYQAEYSPLTHYDPNASGRPRNLLLYDSKGSAPKDLNGS